MRGYKPRIERILKKMKNIVLILCILMLGMPSMAQTIKVHVNEQPSQQQNKIVKLGGGFTNGKAYTTVKINNKQVLRLNSKKLTGGMLSFVNVRF